MGVTHGKKRDHNLQHSPVESRTHLKGPASVPSVLHTHQDGKVGGEEPEVDQELREQEVQTPPSQLQREEESSDLIRPKKPLNPVIASKSHQELHKELQMTQKRGVCPEGKSELQRVLERRNWEQRMKERRDLEEAKKNTTPLYQELLKRHQRLDELEREKERQQEGPEFLRIKERLRRTTVSDVGEKEVKRASTVRVGTVEPVDSWGYRTGGRVIGGL